MFTDAHCHLLKDNYNDLSNVVKEAQKKGVNRYIVNAYNLTSSKEILKLVTDFDNIYGTIGLHPENINEEFDYKIFDNLPKKIIAVGEIGLDYYYTKDNKEDQIRIFEKQLSIAQKLKLPVVIHSRDATQDTLDILKKYDLKVYIHSFSGSAEVAREYLKRGYILGINGVITFKNCKIKDVYHEVGLENCVLETDSPYLTPTPFRGQKNDPSHIKDIVEFIEKEFDISKDELAKITNNNLKRIFDI